MTGILVAAVLLCGAGNLACSRLSAGLLGAEYPLTVRRESRLKAGCSQDWLPHKEGSS